MKARDGAFKTELVAFNLRFRAGEGNVPLVGGGGVGHARGRGWDEPPMVPPRALADPPVSAAGGRLPPGPATAALRHRHAQGEYYWGTVQYRSDLFNCSRVKATVEV